MGAAVVKLTKLEADQLMEKFSKLAPEANVSSLSMSWSDGYSRLELDMWRTRPWELTSKVRNEYFNYDTKGTLNFNVFPLWQRFRLMRFFKRIRNDAMRRQREALKTSIHRESTRTVSDLIGRNSA